MMKLMIVSVIIVMAVAFGLFLSSGAYGGFFSAFIQSSSDAYSDAQLTGDNADSDDVGFTIKMGSRSGGVASTTDDDSPEDEDETVVEEEENETDNTPLVTYTGTTKKKSKDSDGDDGNNNDNPGEEVKTTVTVQPPQTTADANSTFTVSVEIDTEDAVYAAAIRLSFDSSVLEALSVTTGDFLNSDGQSTCPGGIMEVTDIEDGLVSYDTTRCQAKSGSTGSGTMFEVEFKAIAAGSSDLTLQSVKLFDYDELSELEFEADGGSVNVQ